MLGQLDWPEGAVQVFAHGEQTPPEPARSPVGEGAGQRAGDIAYAPASLKRDAHAPSITTPWMPLHIETTDDTTLADLTGSKADRWAA